MATFHEPDAAREAFEATLSGPGFDYVDLFLIHWPLPTLYDGDFVSTWKVLEEFHGDGRALDRRVQLPDWAPRAAGRRDRHGADGKSDRGASLLTNEAVRTYGREHGIATERVGTGTCGVGGLPRARRGAAEVLAAIAVLLLVPWWIGSWPLLMFGVPDLGWWLLGASGMLVATELTRGALLARELIRAGGTGVGRPAAPPPFRPEARG